MSTRLLSSTRDRLRKGNPYALPLQVLSLDAYKGITQIQKPKMTRKRTAFSHKQVSLLYKDAFWPKECGQQTSHSPLQNTQEVGEEGTSVGLRSKRSFHAAQAAYSSTSHASRTPTREEYDYVPICDRRRNSAVLLTDRGTDKHRILRKVNTQRTGDHYSAMEKLILANVDTRLVANQSVGRIRAKEDNMVQYLDKTKSLIQGFDRFTIRQVPRGDNKKADALSKIASTSFAHLSKQVLVEILKNKSISEMEISTVIEEQDPTWMTPIVEFINTGTLPHEQKDARRIRRTAQRFELREGVLYRRSFPPKPWLSGAFGPIQADYVLREIHAGSCSMHSGPRSVVARALRSGELTPITSPWPFHKWGIDIAGPFPVAAGGLKFLIVAIDYFTKWIEAKAVATITGNQTNGLVERANRSLGEGIKARLDRHKGRWVEELSHVLWAHRTTIKVSTGDTPSICLMDGSLIPAEIGMPTISYRGGQITTKDYERRKI
ncbi:reverse transcriptase domain-containing protein [Tanacetum coccineum]